MVVYMIPCMTPRMERGELVAKLVHAQALKLTA